MTGWRSAGMGMLALALAACGGGTDDEAEDAREASGVFQAGGVSGLHYSTPTRAGTTDAAGTFKYLPGETVTFSIGAIELGSAPGAAVVTPFTIAGLTPPTTEYALRRELDRARRGAPPLVRATNIMSLLIGLDGDHDPANGIDVSANAAALANANIDFDIDLWSFASRQQKLAPRLTQVAIWYPLVHLYRALGIAVPVHGQTLAETYFDFGTLPWVDFTTYGADGTRASSGFDVDDDGVPEALNSWTYDSLGRTLTVYGHYPPFIGIYPVNRTSTYEYDARGAVTAGLDELDQDDDGVIDYTYRFARPVDDYGFPLSTTIDQDYNADGSTDSRQLEVYTFDTRHNFASGIYQIDFDFDGIQDQLGTAASTYDSNDRQLTGVSEFDDDADGTIDRRNRQTYVYESSKIRDIWEEDYQADGIVDYRAVNTSTLDRAGNIILSIHDIDVDADGVVEYRTRYELTYDAHRRRLTEVRLEDYEADGIIDYTSNATSTYDPIGNLLTSRVEFDNGQNPPLENFAYDEFSYGASGEPLTRRSEPYGSTTYFTNTEFDDGVLLLAQEFLSIGGVTN